MKVLITGATGFVGRHLLHKLEQNSNLTQIDCYVRNDDQRSSRNIIETDPRIFHVDFWQILKNEYNLVYHIAANPKTSGDPQDLFDSNVQLTFDLLESIKEIGRASCRERV